MPMLQRVLLNVAGVLLALFIVGPLVWMVDASFQSESELSARPIHLLPQLPSLDNYRYVFTGAIPHSLLGNGVLTPNISQEAREILPALKNSTIVAAATAAIVPTTRSTAAVAAATMVLFLSAGRISRASCEMFGVRTPLPSRLCGRAPVKT